MRACLSASPRCALSLPPPPPPSIYPSWHGEEEGYTHTRTSPCGATPPSLPNAEHLPHGGVRAMHRCWYRRRGPGLTLRRSSLRRCEHVCAIHAMGRASARLERIPSGPHTAYWCGAAACHPRGRHQGWRTAVTHVSTAASRRTMWGPCGQAGRWREEGRGVAL